MDTAKNLPEQAIYRKSAADPTNKCNAKLINILKRIKKESGMDDNMYRRMYPTEACSPKSYSLPNIHKNDPPFRSKVFSRDSVAYSVAKKLCSILQPLVSR